ncbi:Mobile element protein [hydrothermal vent metagenome]|uniref:Mobile element protein n=1 Tax=hydrothermal vent metagenome TaxID=652676 RepID=A0A3B0YHY1_9ZZZZ
MKERKKLIDRDSAVSLRKQSNLLGVCRSSLYFEPKGESDFNLSMMKLIDKHHLEHPAKGVLQMSDYLNGLGYKVNDKRVRRLMRLQCIEAIYPKQNLSKRGLIKYIKPYLLRGLIIDRPNQVWAIDITYIPMEQGFMYLSAVIDLYSRFVVGWRLSNSLEAATQTELINQCIAEHGTPQIINSDQGSQYTSPQWEACLQSHGVKISMDGKGRATDNAFIERLWRTVKQEYVYLNPEKDTRALYNGLKTFFEYYNNERTHQGIGRKLPVQMYLKAA